MAISFLLLPASFITEKSTGRVVVSVWNITQVGIVVDEEMEKLLKNRTTTIVVVQFLKDLPKVNHEYLPGMKWVSRGKDNLLLNRNSLLLM